ncbi:hypothetical protein [Actinoplanes sp. NPDC048796]|uniref:hypothetical protein n=1 Tax=unclassified Actinoplanes TaxID=2626549 RepID=UPI0033C8FE15
MTGNDDPPATGLKWTWQFTVAVILIVLFLVLAALMFFGADTSETVWQRRVYVFGAIEAIVFTAVGWIFGKEVHRAEAESAKAEASEAKQEAKENADAAVDASVKLTAEQTKGRMAAAAVRHMNTGAGGARMGGGSGSDINLDDEAAPGDGRAVTDLKAFFDELYPGG